MELDLVTALTAANITVLQPSHIQQQDKPVDIPYLFVRLISLLYVQTVVWKFSSLKNLHGSMKPRKFIKRIFLKTKLVQQFHPYLERVVLLVSLILILPWIKVLLPRHS